MIHGVKSLWYIEKDKYLQAKLNEESNIHDKGMHTKEIEDLAMEGFIPSIPEVEFFSNEDICIISKEEVRNWPNE